MKSDHRYEEAAEGGRDHDAGWRERIQRALRDLRSISNLEQRVHQQTRSE